MWNYSKEVRDFRNLRELRDLRGFRDFRDFIFGFSVAALFAAQGRHALRKAAILTEVLG